MRSRDPRQLQKTPQGAYSPGVAVKPQGPGRGQSVAPAQVGEPPRGTDGTSLMEQVLNRQNIMDALKRVKQNGGAPGVNGVPTTKLADHIRAERPRIREELLTGTYRPMPVRRVEIPKPGGGKRLLGIPTVMDRLIQQALLQVLTPIFDRQFSESSYGFQSGRRGHDAVPAIRFYKLMKAQKLEAMN